MDLLSSLLITATGRLIVLVLTAKEVVPMTDRLTKLRNAVRAFIKDTVFSFGLVVILKAALAPHALRGIPVRDHWGSEAILEET